MVKQHMKIFLVVCGIFVCILSYIFFTLNIGVSNYIAQNIEKEILKNKKNTKLIDLIDKNQHDISLMCSVPRYYPLHKLKNKLPINNFNYYKFFLIDLFYGNEQSWWFLSLTSKDEVFLYRMPYKFVLDKKDFFCFTPDARLNYLGKHGMFFHLSVEE